MAKWLHGGDRRAFLPGATSHGHHQIEMRCDVCHFPEGQGSAPGAVRKDACVACHGEELKRVRDSHPERKFADPRHADLLLALDARECATCHVEHRPQWTDGMGVTLPLDYCAHCHQDIARERPSHEGMGFETCATAGCHNFHDNQALYEDFLAAHLDEPDMLERPFVPVFRVVNAESDTYATPAVAAGDADAPPSQLRDETLVAAWAGDAHAAAGVNCTACHGESWNPKPAWTSCRDCHRAEAAGFLEGRHGMRLAQGLDPMKVEWARIPMKADAAHRELTCVSCHGAHGFDTRRAAVESCLQCHDDGHSRAYAGSPHHRAWQREMDGLAPAGSGVSCATCHMPRLAHGSDSTRFIHADHNQNATLRPNEKMLRPVCLECHGLGFAMEALADPARIAGNFSGPPSAPSSLPASLDMVRARIAEYARAREGRKESPQPQPGEK
jgi:hypothetical protein